MNVPLSGGSQPAKQAFWNRIPSYYDTFALKSALNRPNIAAEYHSSRHLRDQIVVLSGSKGFENAAIRSLMISMVLNIWTLGAINHLRPDNRW